MGNQYIKVLQNQVWCSEAPIVDSWAPEFYQHICTERSCEQITDLHSYFSLMLHRISHCPRVKAASWSQASNRGA